MALAALALTAPPVAAAEQLRVEIPGAPGALWLDLDQQRWWLEGDCDGGGRPLLAVSGQGERWTVELEDELRLAFSRHPLAAVQRFHLELDGREGRLRLRSPQGLEEIEVPVRVEQHRERTACPGGRDRRN